MRSLKIIVITKMPWESAVIDHDFLAAFTLASFQSGQME